MAPAPHATAALAKRSVAQKPSTRRPLARRSARNSRVSSSMRSSGASGSLSTASTRPRVRYATSAPGTALEAKNSVALRGLHHVEREGSSPVQACGAFGVSLHGQRSVPCGLMDWNLRRRGRFPGSRALASRR